MTNNTKAAATNNTPYTPPTIAECKRRPYHYAVKATLWAVRFLYRGAAGEKGNNNGAAVTMRDYYFTLCALSAMERARDIAKAAATTKRGGGVNAAAVRAAQKKAAAAVKGLASAERAARLIRTPRGAGDTVKAENAAARYKIRHKAAAAVSNAAAVRQEIDRAARWNDDEFGAIATGTIAADMIQSAVVAILTAAPGDDAMKNAMRAVWHEINVQARDRGRKAQTVFRNTDGEEFDIMDTIAAPDMTDAITLPTAAAVLEWIKEYTQTRPALHAAFMVWTDCERPLTNAERFSIHALFKKARAAFMG